jgi:hypothetical protein
MWINWGWPGLSICTPGAVWKRPQSAVAVPITYAINGEQYIAFAVGISGGFAA